MKRIAPRSKITRIALLAIALGLLAQFGLARTGAAQPAEAQISAKPLASPAPDLPEIDALWMRGERPALESIARSLDPQANPYKASFVLWRLHSLNRNQDPQNDYQAAAIDRAEQLAEALTKDESISQSERVEALVLLSSILGIRADGSLFQRMRLGRAAHLVINEARELDEANPRAKLQHAILLFHTPSTFGGGPAAALPLLLEARRDLDPKNQPAPSGPPWGWLDASAWVGQTLAALDREEEARQVYEETLAREPAMGWIRHQLLPALSAN